MIEGWLNIGKSIAAPIRLLVKKKKKKKKLSTKWLNGRPITFVNPKQDFKG